MGNFMRSRTFYRRLYYIVRYESSRVTCTWESDWKKNTRGRVSGRNESTTCELLWSAFANSEPNEKHTKICDAKSRGRVERYYTATELERWPTYRLTRLRSFVSVRSQFRNDSSSSIRLADTFDWAIDFRYHYMKRGVNIGSSSLRNWSSF